MAAAAFFPAPIARITVAAPVTISPPRLCVAKSGGSMDVIVNQG